MKRHDYWLLVKDGNLVYWVLAPSGGAEILCGVSAENGWEPEDAEQRLPLEDWQFDMRRVMEAINAGLPTP